jgi:hypothetical protein
MKMTAATRASTTNQSVSCSATPVILNEWFAAFGLGDDVDEETTTVAADESDDTFYENEEEEDNDESTNNDTSMKPPQQSQQQRPRRKRSTSSSSSLSTHCNATTCRLQHGICVDCCKCSKHCTCSNTTTTTTTTTVIPSTCDTKDCSSRVCSECMRCTMHCSCHGGEGKDNSMDYVAFSSSSSPTTKEQQQQQQRLLESMKKNKQIRSSDDHHSNQEMSLEVPYITNYFGGRSRSSLVKYDTDEEEEDNNNSKEGSWMGKTHVMTSDGTVSSTTAEESSIRQTKTNYEVVYGKQQSEQQSSVSFITTTTRTIPRSNIEKENIQNNLGGSRSWQADINSNGTTTTISSSSELAEF